VNGLRQGTGIFEHANGDSYRGNWCEDKKNGFGITIFPDGSV